MKREGPIGHARAAMRAADRKDGSNAAWEIDRHSRRDSARDESSHRMTQEVNGRISVHVENSLDLFHRAIDLFIDGSESHLFEGVNFAADVFESRSPGFDHRT